MSSETLCILYEPPKSIDKKHNLDNQSDKLKQNKDASGRVKHPYQAGSLGLVQLSRRTGQMFFTVSLGHRENLRLCIAVSPRLAIPPTRTLYLHRYQSNDSRQATLQIESN